MAADHVTFVYSVQLAVGNATCLRCFFSLGRTLEVFHDYVNDETGFEFQD